ncbi:hypothetical protein Bca52824_080406 [Brassica carinata]|uniref:Reverse transcriptase zinc-binding domain-containing protein n=1 Tax=Brassica carinata TaxID=52824 RepID=A0A8X7PFF3_BRACI|nr:hypothetical protein Bca52824_080406 [Brassica carinata]
MGPAHMATQSLLVKELLCPLTNKWNLEEIRRIIPQYEDFILHIKTSSTQSPDTMVWLKEKSGEYSTKTGYGLGMVVDRPTLVANEPVHWLKDIWNVNTSPKLKDFIWRVVKKAIPVSSNLERRGVPRFNCKKCGGYEDDMHVFLSCSIAEEVWSLIPITQGPGSSISSVPELIKQGKQYVPLPPTGLNAPLWPWVMWNLWKARNKLVFENRAFSAQEIVLKSITDAKEWNDAQPGGKSHTQDNPSPVRPHCNSTVPPPSLPATILVCKVDAAWDASSGGCGIGGIFGGSNDRNLSNVSEAYSHVSSALMAEAIAVHRAVALAWVYTKLQNLVSSWGN